MTARHSREDSRGRLDVPGRPQPPDYAKLCAAFEAAVRDGQGDGVAEYGAWLGAFEDYSAACAAWQVAADREWERLDRLYSELRSEGRSLADLGRMVGGDVNTGSTSRGSHNYSAAEHEQRVAAWRELAAAYDPGQDWSAVEPSADAVPLPPFKAPSCRADPSQRPPGYSVARDAVLNAMARAGA